MTSDDWAARVAALQRSVHNYAEELPERIVNGG
jgi:hypothetical protein